MDKLTLINEAVHRSESRLVSITGIALTGIRKIFFDFDGTLIDSLWIMEEGLIKTLSLLLNPEAWMRGERPTKAETDELGKLSFLRSVEKGRMIVMQRDIIEYAQSVRSLSLEQVQGINLLEGKDRPAEGEIETLVSELREVSPDRDFSNPDLLSLAKTIFHTYSNLYVPIARGIIEAYQDFKKNVYPGLGQLLKGLHGVEKYIVSGGSSPRISSVAEKAGLTAFFKDGIYGPGGVDRLARGGRFKTDSAVELSKGCGAGEILFIDDGANIIAELNKKGFKTIGIVHQKENTREMLDANPDFILTHNFLAFAKEDGLVKDMVG